MYGSDITSSTCIVNQQGSLTSGVDRVLVVHEDVLVRGMSAIPLVYCHNPVKSWPGIHNTAWQPDLLCVWLAQSPYRLAIPHTLHTRFTSCSYIRASVRNLSRQESPPRVYELQAHL